MTGTEFVGNRLCLDFANTVNARPVAAHDALDSVAELVDWARLAGLRPAAGLAREPASSLVAARELREAVYRVFAAVAADRPPDGGDLATITTGYAEALAAAGLHREGGRFAPRWPPPGAVRPLLWRVAASAGRLLTEGPLDRVGECPSCGWVFLDTSRNGRRRWCSMATCGGRVKARRHHANRGRPAGDAA